MKHISKNVLQYKLDPEVYLSGAYTFHFLFDARYVQSKRVIIQID